jgi:hypothetical protein
MKSTILALSILFTLLFIPIISAGIANLTFYGVWIGAGPDSIITKVVSHPPSSLPYLTVYPTDALQFESTLILPAGSPDKTPANDVQAFWPGMEPASMNGVLQNVITTQGGGPGEWFLLPF